jgi:hypothetical protein
LNQRDASGLFLSSNQLRYLESVIIMTSATKAEALFVSSLQPSDHPTIDQIVRAIRTAQRTRGGESGCAVAFAAEYGEHPEASAERMRWALSQVIATSRTFAA